jgi:tetratricopeptide (TPR) repeat protein
MKKNINYFALLLLLVVLITACKNEKHIANKANYEVYLNPSFQKKMLQENEAEINFWKTKLAQDTSSYVHKLQICSNTLAHFKLAGTVNDLHIADSIYNAVSASVNNKESAIYLSLAQNAITQHKFKEAQEFVFAAEKIGADAAKIAMLQFDVAMELGNYVVAKLNLDKLNTTEKNFDYLIRNAKYQDHLGNSETSIMQMEKAYGLVKNNNKKSVIVWVTTNLGDMYAHAGRVEDAYTMYLKSLEVDSANLYALKGIATICFANDKNAEAAEGIYKFILSTTDAPDLNLNLAEIAEWKKDLKSKEMYINKFVSKIESNNRYGNMYNKYLVDVFLYDKINVAKALSIAENEMENRRTPETYTWLALANYKANKKTEAASIIKTFVLNKTSEPLCLYAASVILKETDKAKADMLQATCAESAFEIGPIKMERLRKGI